MGRGKHKNKQSQGAQDSSKELRPASQGPLVPAAAAPSADVATAAPAAPTAPALSTAQYESLYKIAVEEYRFSVNIGWDRLKFFVTLSFTLAGVVPSLIKLSESDPFHRVGAAVLFLSGLTALLGIFVVRKGHSYYRNARGHLKGLERRLGLATENLGLVTTEGMKRARAADSQGPEASTGGRVFNITNGAVVLLLLITLYDFGLGYLAWTGSFPGKSSQAADPARSNIASQPPGNPPGTGASSATVDGGVISSQASSRDAGTLPDAGTPDAGP